MERAEAGEQITTAVARKILAETRKQKPKEAKPVPADKLVKSLEGYKERWNQKDLAELARQLREFVDGLERLCTRIPPWA